MQLADDPVLEVNRFQVGKFLPDVNLEGVVLLCSFSEVCTSTEF